ncbi:MAG: hypothetical protein AAB612_04580, partial [Patescibacteria group bacterium]
MLKFIRELTKSFEPTSPNDNVVNKAVLESQRLELENTKKQRRAFDKIIARGSLEAYSQVILISLLEGSPLTNQLAQNLSEEDKQNIEDDVVEII